MFGLNNAQLIGRLGADVTVNNLANGGKVANLSIATDESFTDRNSGDRVDRTEWHRVVTFQAGLVEMFEKHARKGRLVYVAGKLQTRRWKKDGEDSDRFSTEIILVPGSRVQFLDRPTGNGEAGGPRTGDAARHGERRRRSRRPPMIYPSEPSISYFLSPWVGASRAGLFFCGRFRARPRPGRSPALRASRRAGPSINKKHPRCFGIRRHYLRRWFP